MTTRYPITHTSITVPTAAGTTLLTAADAAAQRTALGVDQGRRAYTAGDFTATNGTSTTASIVAGRLRMTLDANVRRYGTIAGAWTTTAARGVLTLPTGLREVIVLSRVQSSTGTVTQYKSLTTALRGGPASDPSDITGSEYANGGIALPGVNHFDSSSALYGGEIRSDSFASSIFTPVSTFNWSTAPTQYVGLRWTRGAVSFVAAPANATTTDDVMALGPINNVSVPMLPEWPVPTQAVVALQQFSGGASSVGQVDADILVWCWT